MVNLIITSISNANILCISVLRIYTMTQILIFLILCIVIQIGFIRITVCLLGGHRWGEIEGKCRANYTILTLLLAIATTLHIYIYMVLNNNTTIITYYTNSIVVMIYR